MRHAASHVDAITAQAAARALLADLGRDPLDLRRLEALLMLGMAHPALLARHGIEPAREGERLALLWERAGQVGRAAALRATLAEVAGPASIPAALPAREPAPLVLRAPDGASRPQPVDARRATAIVVEQRLQAASTCVARGLHDEAQAHLRAVLELDPTRKDVARMSRDLAHARLASQKRRRRVALGAALLACACFAAWSGWRRERAIAADFASLPPLVAQDAAALESRLASLQGLRAARGAWFGMGALLREEEALRARLDELALVAERRRQAEEERLAERRLEADAWRERARQAAEQGDFGTAQAHYSRALGVADPLWEHRARTERDAVAVSRWLAARAGGLAAATRGGGEQ
jgi:tetratricopeptide (TPR) repeat protein